MKNLFLAILLIAGFSTFAQEKKQERSERPRMSVEDQVNRLKKNLDLNEKQTAQVSIIIEEQNKKREAKKAEWLEKRGATKPTQEERIEMKKKMGEEQETMKAQMKKILTADQYAKWEEKREEKREHMLKKFEERKSRKEEK